MVVSPAVPGTPERIETDTLQVRSRRARRAGVATGPSACHRAAQANVLAAGEGRWCVARDYCASVLPASGGADWARDTGRSNTCAVVTRGAAKQAGRELRRPRTIHRRAADHSVLRKLVVRQCSRESSSFSTPLEPRPIGFDCGVRRDRFAHHLRPGSESRRLAVQAQLSAHRGLVADCNRIDGSLPARNRIGAYQITCGRHADGTGAPEPPSR